jgi:hypothetical protein
MDAEGQSTDVVAPANGNMNVHSVVELDPAGVDQANSTQNKERRRKGSPQLHRAKEALSEIYGEQMPDSNWVSTMEMHRKVLVVLKKLNLGEVSLETVARAAGRRK